MSLASTFSGNDTSKSPVPYLPVKPQTLPPSDLPVHDPATPVPSDDLRDEIARIQTEEQARIDREKQIELARLRELARYD